MPIRPVSDPKRLRRLYELLDTALDLPESERDAWLARVDAADRELVPRLRELLAASRLETDDFMRQPAAARLGELDASEVDLSIDRAGDQIGPYRLMSELGAGGMAAVWLAERIDGTLGRQVALKLPRVGWRAGLAQRMMVERDLLAALEHPHIARLYDAGVTPQGRPWLAMERVQGEPIDAYCLARALAVPQILRLALQVCDALAHAHARLIVHRDLKPANILVTGEGQVRLVDFGVGKLLEAPAESGTNLTQVLGGALTPDYASPEQVAGKPLTVATDVYSIGVVLYELLAGQRPYRLARASAAALEEAILAADLARASARAVDASRARVLKGDLDAVLGKALARDPAERYASIEAFAADLRAHLDGRPVAAQPPSARYVLGKFLRRHRLALAALSVTAAALITGSGVAWWQAREARRQADIALVSLERATTAVEFAKVVLMEGMDADETVTLRQLIERAVNLAARSFTGRPAEQATTAIAVADWLARTGERIRSERLLAQTLEDLPPDAPVALRVELQCHRAYTLVRMGRTEEGARLLDEALAQPVDDGAVQAWCLHRRAATASALGRPEEELRLMERAAQALERAVHVTRSQRAHLLADLGSALWENGRQREGERHFQTAFSMLESVGLGGSQASISARHNYAFGLLDAGVPRDALNIADEVIAAEEKRAPGGGIVLEPLQMRAQALLLLAEYQAAADAYARLAEGARQQVHPRTRLIGLAGQGGALLQLGRIDDAQRLFDDLQAAMAQHERAQSVSVQLPSAVQLMLAQWHAQAGRWTQARELADAIVAAGGPRRRTATRVQALVLRVEAALREARLDDAERDAAAAEDMARRTQGHLPHSLFVAAAGLATAKVRLAQGRIAEAGQAARTAQAHAAATAGETHPWAVQAGSLLSEASGSR